MRLKNIKKIPIEIATLLAANEDVVRLVYDDEPSVLINKKTIQKTIQELIESNYINFYPASETGINTIDRSTFIIINLEDVSFNRVDNNVASSGAIYITTDKAHSLLTGNKIRLLELADCIESTLDGQKLSSAGEIRITSMHYIVFSDFRSGYRILFDCVDQQNRKAEL